jgi:hypothetical protein
VNKKISFKPLALAVSLAFATASHAGSLPKVDHVLIVSVDGMHQQDLTLCIKNST